MNAGRDHQLLERLLCGDADERDPEVAAILEAHPDLRARLAGLRAVAGRLSELGAPATVGEPAEDRSPDETVRPADPARVRAALLQTRASVRRRRLAAAAALLAAAAVVAGLVQGGPRTGPSGGDGRLGGGEAVAVDASGGSMVVTIDEQLPPGGSFRLRLEIPGRPALTAASDRPRWTFPPEWSAALASAASARLVVEVADAGGLAVVHSMELK